MILAGGAKELALSADDLVDALGKAEYYERHTELASLLLLAQPSALVEAAIDGHCRAVVALLAAGATGSQKKRRGSFAPPSPSPQPASPWREVDATPGYWQGEGEAAFKTTELVQTDSDGREWTVCFDHEGSKYYYAPDLDESRWVL